MKVSVERKHNLDNLQFVCDRIADLDFCIFFGTLLGFQREGNIILNDDDIDIYVHSSQRQDILESFAGTELKIREELPRNSSQHFLQGVRIIDSVRTFVDFYFFEDNPEEEYIIERWNFSGRWNNPNNTMHVPKSMFYPLKNTEMQGVKIKVPADPAGICQYLYGKDWQQPMAKGSQYRIGILNNAPRFIPIEPATE